jgi:sugar/nucleoside kinase (ribokinase family)
MCVSPAQSVTLGGAPTPHSLPVHAQDLTSNFEVQYIAGGATQNSIRVAQWLAQTAGTTSYIGCIGKDEYGEQLKTAAAKDGVETHYLEDEVRDHGTSVAHIRAWLLRARVFA